MLPTEICRRILPFAEDLEYCHSQAGSIHHQAAETGRKILARRSAADGLESSKSVRPIGGSSQEEEKLGQTERAGKVQLIQPRQRAAISAAHATMKRTKNGSVSASGHRAGFPGGRVNHRGRSFKGFTHPALAGKACSILRNSSLQWLCHFRRASENMKRPARKKQAAKG